ncbi:hypothetical protein B0A55_09853 [Friedmanniomyces simplex]|uniref:Uncharacterized protein n=1 Tax=Friedmanniomyces simplex TaxID=329884 RepID=A0A4U0WPD0_9PEZI|nr:hypothetical protein B0A55_09853 [Friedmanniomyces simplex]
MADNDGDSHMDSPPELFDLEDVQTPADQLIPDPSILSPPDSQHRSAIEMPTSAPGVVGANSNGKRPLNTISNGGDEDPNAVIDLTAAAPTIQLGNGKARAAGGQDFAPKTHQPSGYTWDKHEDEPRYAWMSKKAQDERQRAREGLVHKDSVVGNRYGDPFEMVEREQAIINSLKQR